MFIITSKMASLKRLCNMYALGQFSKHLLAHGSWFLVLIHTLHLLELEELRQGLVEVRKLALDA